MNITNERVIATFDRGPCPAIFRWLILASWTVLVIAVVVGSLLSAQSPLIAEFGRLHISDKVLHFCAYLAVSGLPVIGFRDRRRGVVVGLSMFLLSAVLEFAQHYAPGRTVELGDVLANGAGVSCGTLLGLPVRAFISAL